MDLVEYHGRMVPKADFRAFVYGANNGRKVVESWEEYQKALQSGYWFEEQQEKQAEKQKPKRKRGK